MSGSAGIQQWKPYPAYKDSGVEWLGQVPKEWEVKQIKQASPVLRGASPRPIDSPIYFSEEGEFAWVRIADVTASNTYLEKTTQRLSDLGASLSVKLEPGELFLSIAGSVGKSCISSIKCCIHDGFVYFPYLVIDKKFLFYVFESGESYKGLGKMGTQLNLNTDTVGSIKLAVPPEEQMQKIVFFLDKECARIDALIAKKRRLLELLEEKRRAVITQAVTRGFDPNAPMKDSGVEWLGQVPEGWTVSRSLFYFDFVTSGSRAWAKFYAETGSPFVRIGNIKRDSIEPDFSNLIFVDAPDGMEAERTTIKEGDIFISITADIGSVGIANKIVYGGYISQHIALCRPDRKTAFPRYLAYALSSFIAKKQLLSFSYGGTKVQLSLTDVKNIYLSLPSLPEQQAIASYLDAATAHIDAQRQAHEKSIALLQEYRASLITHAVTGKIDVREYAPQQ